MALIPAPAQPLGMTPLTCPKCAVERVAGTDGNGRTLLWCPQCRREDVVPRVHGVPDPLGDEQRKRYRTRTHPPTRRKPERIVAARRVPFTARVLASVERHLRVGTPLAAEAARLGYRDNAALRSALRDRLGMKAYQQLMAASDRHRVRARGYRDYSSGRR